MIETRRRPSTKAGALFATALGAITLIGPLAIHLFLPVMPAVKSAFAISDAVLTICGALVSLGAAIAAFAIGRRRRRPIVTA